MSKPPILVSALLLLFMLFSKPAHSQDVITKLADSCCVFLQTVDPALPYDQLTMQLGLCFLRCAEPYKKELKSKYGVNLDGDAEEGAKKLGGLIGLKMATQCPSNLLVLSDAVKKTDDDKSDEPDEPRKYLVGTLVEVQKGQFATVLIKDANGRDQKLLWLNYFHDSEKLKAPDKLKKTEMKFYYNEMELYNPAIEDYMTYKVLTKLEEE